MPTNRPMPIRSVTLALCAAMLLTACGKEEPAQPTGGDPADAQQAPEPALATNRPAQPRGASDRRVEANGLVAEVLPGAGRFDERVVIRRGESIVWERTGGAFRFDSRGDRNGDLGRYGLGEDATGDGVPDLIVAEYSGGAECCWTFHVVSMGEPVMPIASIAAQYGGMFEDLDSDGVPEFVGRDWTFASWQTSLGTSPAPEIVLKYDGTGYVVAQDLMQKPAPDDREIERRIEAVLTSDGWDDAGPPPSLWGEALDLMYAGHEELGWQFMLWAWPDGLDGRDEFIAQFREQLDQSPYAPTLLSGL